MTNAPATRKTHVIRILFTNKNGDVISDKWVDVERMDIVKFTLPGASTNYQGLQRKFRWMDNPDGGDYNPDGNPSRVVEIVKVCDPTEDDLENPEEWAPVPVIKRMRYIGSDQNFQGKVDRFINQLVRQSRKVKTRRIVHYDTNIDDEAQAAFDSDPNRKVYVVSGNRYQKDLNTKDEDQYVEHEVILYTKQLGNYHYNDDGSDHSQGRQTKWLNQYLIDESDEAEFEEIGPSGFNPPYRLDPFQNIVNINLGIDIDLQWLLAIKADAAIGSPFDPWPPPMHALAADGSLWNGVSNGASGLGFTVVSAGCVAFGTITNPEGGKRKCFLRSDPSINAFPAPPCNVYMGVPGVNGGIDWNLVYTAPATVVALSFANDAFFITHLVGPNDLNIYTSAVVLTRDGVNFITSDPFATLTELTWAGNVAYNKASKVYCCISSKFILTDDDTSSSSMAWSVSSNGTQWSSNYQSNVYAQPGQNGSPTRTTICAGNGIFVAAADFKNRFPAPETAPPGSPDYVITTCAVATSVNGTNWNMIKLPGSIARSSTTLGDRGGNTFAVAFVRDSEDDPSGEREGYFVACGQEAGGIEFINTTKLWISHDGLNWSLIKQEDSSVFHPTHYDALTAIAKNIDPEKLIII